jgi:hypothetical protein
MGLDRHIAVQPKKCTTAAHKVGDPIRVGAPEYAGREPSMTKGHGHCSDMRVVYSAHIRQAERVTPMPGVWR